MGATSKICKFVVKHADVILAAIGVGGVTYGLGLAVHQTLDHAEEIKECQKDIDATKEWTSEEEPKVRRREIAKSYGRSAKKLIVIYGPTSAIISASLFSIMYGHKILQKRHLALLAAYESVDKSYKKYRGNVISNEGKEADICYRHNLKAEKLNDETVYVPADDIFIPDRDLSDFAVFWGRDYSMSASQDDDPEENMARLKQVEDTANGIFEAQGYLYLQDVYEMLGVDRFAPDGVGWCKGRGDDFVDIGIFNVRNGRAVNGMEPVFLLDFNHDGYILPYI